MREIAYSQYVLALMDGDVTDEIRHDYTQYLSDYELGAPVFGVVLTVALKQCLTSSQPEDAAMAMVKSEYEALGLDNGLGDYSRYEGYVRTVLHEGLHGGTKMSRCKQLTAAVKDASPIIKDGTYLGAVSSMGSPWTVMENPEYVREVVEYAVNIDATVYGVDIFRTLTELVLSAPAASNQQ